MAKEKKLKEINQEELLLIIRDHLKWLKNPNEGEQADLSNRDFSQISQRIFKNILGNPEFSNDPDSKNNLSKINFSGSTFNATNFSGLNLQEADFSGIISENLDLKSSDLREANFKNATLHKGFLEGTKTARMKFGGADFTNAELPEEITSFDGLKTVEEASKITRKLFAWLLSGLGLSGLFIFSTKDQDLLENTSTSPIPLIQTPVPTEDFYFIAPFLLLGLFLYFNLNLQHMWKLVAKLPAFFPDGSRLDERIFPWMVNKWACNFFPLINKEKESRSKLRTPFVVFLTWYSTPVLLFCFWGRFLSRQHWPISFWQIVLLNISIFAAFYFHSYAKETLRRRYNLFNRLSISTVSLILILIFTFPFSKKVTTGDWTGSIGKAAFYEKIGFFFVDEFALNLEGKDISKKPSYWDPKKPTDTNGVIGASLNGKYLQKVRANFAFLAKADLRNSDLTGGRLSEANLTEADLSKARLIRANLSDAYLNRAQLRDADLTRAKLRSTHLEDAHLERADLSHACLKGADLTGTSLVQTNLAFSVFLNVNTLSSEQIQKARNWKIARYKTEFQESLGITEKDVKNELEVYLKEKNPGITEKDLQKKLVEGFEKWKNADKQLCSEPNLSP